ncbi:MAG: hypothetical protein JWO38_8279, partial [Gemmataceae bacterium]|nr:hypothetical protein [Gemmataceae bacterium]MDB5314077.1 hypothetical protein [Gemmataceae bacterium]
MPPTIPLTPDTLFAQGTVTLAGLAKEFGISRTAAYRLMNAGRLPYTQIGEGG